MSSSEPDSDPIGLQQPGGDAATHRHPGADGSPRESAASLEEPLLTPGNEIPASPDLKLSSRNPVEHPRADSGAAGQLRTQDSVIGGSGQMELADSSSNEWITAPSFSIITGVATSVSPPAAPPIPIPTEEAGRMTRDEPSNVDISGLATMMGPFQPVTAAAAPVSAVAAVAPVPPPRLECEGLAEGVVLLAVKILGHASQLPSEKRGSIVLQMEDFDTSGSGSLQVTVVRSLAGFEFPDNNKGVSREPESSKQVLVRIRQDPDPSAKAAESQSVGVDLSGHGSWTPAPPAGAYGWAESPARSHAPSRTSGSNLTYFSNVHRAYGVSSSSPRGHSRGSACASRESSSRYAPPLGYAPPPSGTDPLSSGPCASGGPYSPSFYGAALTCAETAPGCASTSSAYDDAWRPGISVIPPIPLAFAFPGKPVLFQQPSPGTSKAYLPRASPAKAQGPLAGSAAYGRARHPLSASLGRGLHRRAGPAPPPPASARLRPEGWVLPGHVELLESGARAWGEGGGQGSGGSEGSMDHSGSSSLSHAHLPCNNMNSSSQNSRKLSHPGLSGSGSLAEPGYGLGSIPGNCSGSPPLAKGSKNRFDNVYEPPADAPSGQPQGSTGLHRAWMSGGGSSSGSGFGSADDEHHHHHHHYYHHHHRQPEPEPESLSASEGPSASPPLARTLPQGVEVGLQNSHLHRLFEKVVCEGGGASPASMRGDEGGIDGEKRGSLVPGLVPGSGAPPPVVATPLTHRLSNGAPGGGGQLPSPTREGRSDALCGSSRVEGQSYGQESYCGSGDLGGGAHFRRQSSSLKRSSLPSDKPPVTGAGALATTSDYSRSTGDPSMTQISASFASKRYEKDYTAGNGTAAVPNPKPMSLSSSPSSSVTAPFPPESFSFHTPRLLGSAQPTQPNPSRIKPLASPSVSGLPAPLMPSSPPSNPPTTEFFRSHKYGGTKALGAVSSAALRPSRPPVLNSGSWGLSPVLSPPLATDSFPLAAKASGASSAPLIESPALMQTDPKKMSSEMAERRRFLESKMRMIEKHFGPPPSARTPALYGSATRAFSCSPQPPPTGRNRWRPATEGYY